MFTLWLGFYNERWHLYLVCAATAGLCCVFQPAEYRKVPLARRGSIKLIMTTRVRSSLSSGPNVLELMSAVRSTSLFGFFWCVEGGLVFAMGCLAMFGLG